MCTVVLLRRPWHRWPLILAANRDEMNDRPWRPPARHWSDHEAVVAGLDEQAGGSWLGLNDHGVVAAVLNRVGSLGPKAGKRSRGDLILLALEESDANSAAAAIAGLDPRHYRSFNLVIADRDDAVWLCHEDGEADAAGTAFKMARVGSGLSMITAHDLNDTSSPRISAYRPRFKAAQPPNPEEQEWRAWQMLMASREPGARDDPTSAMTIVTDRRFETTSSSIVALPGNKSFGDRSKCKPIWRFAPGRPDRIDYQTLNLF